MNLEKYKAEMSRNYPDRKFVENTLSAIKNNRRQSGIDKKQVLKTIGGIGLTAAVLGGAVIGGGMVRSLFSHIETDNTQPVEITLATEEAPEPPQIEENKGIIATDEELLATPLASNPMYTVKATTPEGKVSLDENTTVSDALACGVPVWTDNGYVGMRYLCEALRKYKNGEPFEFIAAAINSGTTGYDYYNVDAEGNVKYRYYDHTNYFSITTYNNDARKFAFYTGREPEPRWGVTLTPEKIVNMGVLTIYDLLNETCFDKDDRRELFYYNITHDENLKYVAGYIYKDDCIGKHMMNRFIEAIESGADSAGVQYTDITGTDEYDERYYSIEYCDGVYSVFTMTDGFNGIFDTQYFDGYTISDNRVIFDNGEVSYSFGLSLTPEEDAKNYPSGNYFIGGWYNNIYSEDDLEFSVDSVWLKESISKNIKDYLTINEEYSGDGIYACEVEDYQYNLLQSSIRRMYLKVNEEAVGENALGEKYMFNEIQIRFQDTAFEPVEMPDGKLYAMLTEEQLEILKADYPSLTPMLTEDGLIYDIYVYVYFE